MKIATPDTDCSKLCLLTYFHKKGFILFNVKLLRKVLNEMPHKYFFFQSQKIEFG